MTQATLELIKTLAIAIISSGTVGTLITRWFERRSKVNELSKVVGSMAEGMQILLKNQMELLNILHEKGIINGESAELRKTMSDYLYKSQALNFKQKKIS